MDTLPQSEESLRVLRRLRMSIAPEKRKFRISSRVKKLYSNTSQHEGDAAKLDRADLVTTSCIGRTERQDRTSSISPSFMNIGRYSKATCPKGNAHCRRNIQGPTMLV